MRTNADVDVQTPTGLHKILFRKGAIALSHHTKQEVRRTLILREFGDQDLCPCIVWYRQCLAHLGLRKGLSRNGYHDWVPYYGDVRQRGISAEWYEVYLRRFGGSRFARDDFRLARSWRKAWNRLNRGARREDPYHPSMGNKLGLRYLEFPLCVLFELRYRGHNATMGDNRSAVCMPRHPSRSDEPKFVLQFYGSGGPSSQDPRQYWRIHSPCPGRQSVNRHVAFREDKKEGDRDVKLAADLVEEMWLVLLENSRAMLGSGVTQAKRRRAMLKAMFGKRTSGVRHGGQVTDTRPLHGLIKQDSA